LSARGRVHYERFHGCAYCICVAEAMFQSETLVTGSCSLPFPSQLTVHHLPSSSSEAPSLSTNTGSEGLYVVLFLPDLRQIFVCFVFVSSLTNYKERKSCNMEVMPLQNNINA